MTPFPFPAAEDDGSPRARLAMVAVGILALAAAAFWISIAPAHLASWDAVQFALALDRFDPGMHQPHPPGYVGHLGVGAVLEALGLPGDRAIQGAGLLAAALAIVATGWLGRRLHGPGAGLAAAAILSTNPVLAYYAISGESYPSEVLAAVILVAIAMRVRRSSTLAGFAAAGFAWGLAGAFRPTVPILLGPLVLWRLAGALRGRTAGRTVATVSAALLPAAAGLLSWVIPLAVSAGGWERFVELNRGLHVGMAARAFSPLLDAGAARKSLGLLGWSLVALASFSVPAAAVALASGGARPFRSPARLGLYALWIMPALAWFSLTFFMKAGYALILAPAIACGCGALIAGALSRRPRVAGLAVATVAACQFGVFVAPPGWLGGAGMVSLPVVEAQEAAVAAPLAHIERMSGGDPESVVVATRNGFFKFRQAMYYLPSSEVLWLMDPGSTVGGRAGRQVCRARDRHASCSGEDGFWLATSLPETAHVVLPERARWIAWFLNPAQDFDDELAAAIPTGVVTLPTGATFLATPLAPGPVRFTVQGYSFER